MTRGRRKESRSRSSAAVASVGRTAQRLLWVPVGHLAAVSVAGTLRPGRLPDGEARHAFVILIPARNEEDQVHMPVASALASSYPAALRRVVVVADNCTDATAEEARASGAEVWERVDPARASKGAAIEWGLDRLLAQEDWDAVVVLDADATIAPDFLRVVDRRLADGADVVQGERHVTNPQASIVARLAEVSSAAQCVLRPRGRARMGGAAKLVGNGMVIHRRVLDVCPWRAEGLVEDFEYWLELLQHGIHPVYEPGAVVSDLMPTDLASARVQRSRWEAGRFNLMRDQLGRCATIAVRRRDPVLAEALVSELVFPNLSVTGTAVAAAGLVRWVAGREGAGTVALQTGTIVAHLVLALRAMNASPAAYAALALAPGVVVWRLGVTVEAALKRRALSWQGTPRSSDR